MKYNDLASQLDWGRLVNYCNVIYAAHYVYIKLLIPVYIYTHLFLPIFMGKVKACHGGQGMWWICSFWGLQVPARDACCQLTDSCSRSWIVIPHTLTLSWSRKNKVNIITLWFFRANSDNLIWGSRYAMVCHSEVREFEDQFVNVYGNRFLFLCPPNEHPGAAWDW